MPASNNTVNSPWQRRLRRLFWFIGAAGTFYYISSYALDRMREARIRAVKDRKQRDLIKSHFTSLLSTISFTLYALLPTLGPQINDAYPVEDISLALQSLSTSGLTSTSTSTLQSGDGPSVETSDASASERGGSEVAETPEGSVVMSRGGTNENDNIQQQERADVAVDGRDGQVQVQVHRPLEESVPSTAQSWASEFEQSSVSSTLGMGDSGVLSMGQAETDDGLASAISNVTSLPTDIDISNFSGSPPSDLSASILHSPSPPRRPNDTSSRSPSHSPVFPGQASLQPTVPAPRATQHASHETSGGRSLHGAQARGLQLQGKSKKELWKELKLASISRAITTAIIIPLVHLMTVSQLSTLARRRYLEDVAAGLPTPIDPRTGKAVERHVPGNVVSDHPSTPSASASRIQRDKGFTGGWLHSFSVSNVGLSEFVDESTSLLPSLPAFPAVINPVAYLSRAVSSRLPIPTFLRPGPQRTATTVDAAALAQEEYEWQELQRQQEREEQEAEAERLYLTYSWWVLHEGWKEVKVKVDGEVERVFGGMALKRELRADDWEGLIAEVVHGVLGGENGQSESTVPLNIPSVLLPPTPLPHLPACPLPLTPSSDPSLLALLHETRTHLSSPDARYLVSRGTETLTRRLVIGLKEEIYGIPEFTVLDATGSDGAQGQGGQEREGERKRRLVDCLPALGNWGKDTWGSVPDQGVEGVLGGLEGEGMAGLIFGDWAGRR